MQWHLNESGSEQQKNFQIGHCNIRGIRANLSDLRIHLSSLYDIFCVSQTMLSENVTNDQLAVNDYQSPIRRDRDHNGGGLLIYLSHKVLAKRRVDLESSTVETIWIEVVMKGQKFYYVIATGPRMLG